jgi:hypothetical protein
MRKILLVLTAIFLNAVITKAQPSGCGQPSCEEPGDPGVTRASSDDEVSIYPNPSTGKFTVNFNSKVDEKVSVCVFDVNGRMVHSQFLNCSNERPNSKIDLSGNLRGIYYLNVRNGKISKTTKIIKQ